MDLSKFQDDTILSEWTLVEAEQGEHADLPMDSDDWSRANELRAEIFLPDGVDGQIYCTLTSGNRTEGMSEDDGYRFNAMVSPRGGNIWRGWQEFRFPAECFYTQGIPSGWGQMVSGNIRLPSGSRIRNIRLIEREIVHGPRMTDEALIAALNLNHPGLEAAAQADTTDDQLGAIAAYFRSSTFNRRHVIPDPSLKANLEEANRVLAGHMMGHCWPDGVDWDANPYGYIEWSIRIHGFPYFTPLELAFEEIRDPKYAKAIENILRDWMDKIPMPYGVRAGGLAWGHSLIVSQRAFCRLVDVFTVLCDCSETEDRTIIDLLKSTYEHQVYLLKFESFPPSNKTISEGRSMLAMACSFPEFQEAEAWYGAASQRLLDDMNIQVMPDGASYELTPGYQMAIASWFLAAFEVAQKFGRTLNPELEAGIKRMYTWCVSAGLDKDIAHRRAVMFVKPDYFLIFDELTGEGRHTYEALFHFMPYRVLIDPDTKAVRTGRMDPPNLEILPLVKMTPRLVCGQNDPVQGWLAIGGQDVPAPVAIYKKQAPLPFRTRYAIVPFTEGVTAGVTSKVTRRSDTWNVRITHPDGRQDRIRMDWSDKQGPVLV